MDRLDGILVWVSEALNKIAAFLVLPAMTIMMTADVILRYVFNAPLSWGLEASIHMLLIVFLFGMLEAFRTSAHVRMDLFHNLFPAYLRRGVALLYGVLTIAVFVALVRKAAEESAFQQNIGEVTQYIHMPQWLFAAALAMVAALIVAFFVVRFWQLLRGAREMVEDRGGHFGDGQ